MGQKGVRIAFFTSLGIVFDVISNPGFLDAEATIPLGWLSIPFTILWIIACTNAVNLIDGLDGLAVGISAISSISMMIVSMILPAGVAGIPLILACLAGACFGFMPYNLNPAKIFMGDVGSQFLGFVLSCVSIMGLFKFHAIITFLIPLLSLAVPLGDTIFAFFRRILHGQSPFHADRGHIHHKLIDMGMSQKQAVAVLYAVSAVLGLIAVLRARDRDPHRLHRGRLRDLPDDVAVRLLESTPHRASPSGTPSSRTPGRSRCRTGRVRGRP